MVEAFRQIEYLNQLNHNLNMGWKIGMKHSEESKLKIGFANEGQKRPDLIELNKTKIWTKEMKKRISNAHKGMKHTIETKQKISQAILGINNPFYGKHHTEEAKFKMSNIRKQLIKHGKVKAFGHGLNATQTPPWNKGKPFLAGKLNPRWDGGHQNWRGTEWKKIRRLVLIRDNYTCQKCGEKDKKKLVVDHKIPFHISKDNSLENLQTLCYVCHPKKDWEYFRKF